MERYALVLLNLSPLFFLFTQIESDPVSVFKYRATVVRMDSLGDEGLDPLITALPKLEVQWHVPTADEVAFADVLLAKFFEPALAELHALRQGDCPNSSDPQSEQTSARLRNAFVVVRNVARLGPDVMLEADLPKVHVPHDDEVCLIFGKGKVVLISCRTFLPLLFLIICLLVSSFLSSPPHPPRRSA